MLVAFLRLLRIAGLLPEITQPDQHVPLIFHPRILQTGKLLGLLDVPHIQEVGQIGFVHWPGHGPLG